MSLTQDEILQVLKLLDHSGFDELDLQIGTLKLKARRKGAAKPDAGHSVSVEHHTPMEASRVGCGASAEATLTPRTAATPEVEQGRVPIKAPMLGTFYRRPSPREPAFVEIGHFVKETDTVCLLEVMKVFSAVQAGVRGTIEMICVESGELVEFGQVLFWVRPAQGEDGRKSA